MAATEQTEIERKYAPGKNATPPDFTAIDEIGAVDVGEPVTLTAVYFDTDALDLAAHGIALRRREGGGDDGWHLKMAAPEGTVETHWPLTLDQDDPGEVPFDVLEPVRAIVRDRRVSPIARIETVRAAILLLDEHGMAVAEFADDTVSALDVRRGQPRSWREWEVELLSGAPQDPEGREAFFGAVEPLLAAAGARPSKSHSKLAHSLGLTSLQERSAPKHSHHDTLETLESTSAASVVVTAVRTLVVALHEADPVVRVGGQDSVHAMRRITRQLRSVLASYPRLFAREPVDRLRSELRWLGHVLGEARDAEVRRGRAADELQALPVADADAWRRLVETDRHAYADALDRVRGELLGERYFRLLDELDDFAERPPLRHRAARPARKIVAASVRTQVATLQKRADAAQASDVDRELALHNARKAARRLRYSIVALSGGGGWRPGKRLRAIAAAAKPLVASLGVHRDRVLFAERVTVAAREARAAGEDTFVYGLILGGMNERARSRGDAVLVNLNSAERVITKLARKL